MYKFKLEFNFNFDYRLNYKFKLRVDLSWHMGTVLVTAQCSTAERDKNCCRVLIWEFERHHIRNITFHSGFMSQVHGSLRLNHIIVAMTEWSKVGRKSLNERMDGRTENLAVHHPEMLLSRQDRDACCLWRARGDCIYTPDRFDEVVQVTALKMTEIRRIGKV